MQPIVHVHFYCSCTDELELINLLFVGLFKLAGLKFIESWLHLPIEVRHSPTTEY